MLMYFGQKSSKLNSRPVYCSRLYSNYFLLNSINQVKRKKLNRVRIEIKNVNAKTRIFFTLFGLRRIKFYNLRNYYIPRHAKFIVNLPSGHDHAFKNCSIKIHTSFMSGYIARQTDVVVYYTQVHQNTKNQLPHTSYIIHNEVKSFLKQHSDLHAPAFSR